MPDNSLSLNKFISNTGRCSRREADKLIKEGRVTINGKVAVLGNRVSQGDKVLIDKKPLKSKPRTLYIAFNNDRRAGKEKYYSIYQSSATIISHWST